MSPRVPVTALNGSAPASAKADDLVKSPKQVIIPEFGVAAYESRHDLGFAADVQVDHPQFYLVISGHAQWQGGSCAFTLKENCLLHVPGRIRLLQRDFPGDPVTAYGIHYQPKVVPEFLSAELNRLGPLHWEMGTYKKNVAEEVRSIFQEMLYEQESRQEGWEIVVCSRLLDLAVRTLRLAHRGAASDQPEFVKGEDSLARVANYALALKSRFYRQISLDEAARNTCLSRRQFTELFRRVTGQSWRQYLLGHRLAHAERLLGRTDKSIVAIAFECGFDDLSNFNRMFKQAFRCSPSAFREKVLKSGSGPSRP